MKVSVDLNMVLTADNKIPGVFQEYRENMFLSKVSQDPGISKFQEFSKASRSSKQHV